MAQLEKVLHRKSIESLREEGLQREFAEGLFTDWRDHYTAALCRHIRLCREAKAAGITTAGYPPSIEWCNAAVHLLTHADLMLQDYFMRADEETKTEFVEAILQDRGMYRFDGFFVELPPC